MIVSDTHRFIFIHVPKTSGTSMTRALLETYPDSGLFEGVDAATGVDTMHLHTDVIGSYIDPRAVDEYLKFCIVRNPYDRLFSAWQSLRARYPFRDVNDFVSEQIDPEFILGRELVAMDARVHYRPQHTFAFDQHTQFVDRILRYESLNEDIRQLNEDHGLAIPEYAQARESHADRFSTAAIAKINQVYQRDFELLGYDKRHG